MSALIVPKILSHNKSKVEIDVTELKSRLESILKVQDIEIIQLSISTMLDEIKDYISGNYIK